MMEIERKFLVTGDAWRDFEGEDLVQGYLSVAPSHVVRVRIAGDRAFLTLKSGLSWRARLEFEYPIPLDDARQILQMCPGPLIEKRRHRVPHEGFVWEVDAFRGANQGLVVAEIELESEEQAFKKPSWIGREVTEDPRYLNINLVGHPFSQWTTES